MVGPKENTWYTKSMGNESFNKMIDLSKYQDFYKTPYNSNKGWSLFSFDLNISNWLLYTGGVLITLGLCYWGYLYYTDQTFLEPLISSKHSSSGTSAFPSNRTTHSTTTPAPEIQITDNTTPAIEDSSSVVASAMTFIGGKILGIPRAVSSALNPFSYFQTSNQQQHNFDIFMATQNNMHTANLHYYPFTENNPFSPWYEKWGYALFGESIADKAHRMNLRSYAFRELETLSVKPIDAALLSPRIDTALLSPKLGVGIGINSPINTATVWDAVQVTNLQTTLKSIPTTPTNAFRLPELWEDHIPEAYTNASTSALPLKTFPNFKLD